MANLAAVAAFDVVCRTWLTALGGFVTRLLTVPTVLVCRSLFAWLGAIPKDVTRLTAPWTEFWCWLLGSLRAIFGHMTRFFTTKTARDHTIDRKARILQSFLVFCWRLWPSSCECLPLGLFGTLKSDNEGTIDISLEVHESVDIGNLILLREVRLHFLYQRLRDPQTDLGNQISLEIV